MFLVTVHNQGIYNQLLFEKVDCYYSSKFIYVLYSPVSSARVCTAYSNRTKWKCCTAANGYSNSIWADFKIENVLLIEGVFAEKIIVLKAKLSPLKGKKFKWNNRMHLRQPYVEDFMKSAIPSDTRFVFLPATFYNLSKIGERNSNDKQLLRNEQLIRFTPIPSYILLLLEDLLIGNTLKTKHQ